MADIVQLYAMHANEHGAQSVVAAFQEGHIGRETALEALRIHHGASLALLMDVAYPELETASQKRDFIVREAAEFKTIAYQMTKSG